MTRSAPIPFLAVAALALAQPAGARWEVLHKNATGGFITALAQDLHGNIWVGTEDKGVFRYDGKEWTQFNSKNGLADDNAYASACDQLGRVWVGTLNKGVSVFSGERPGEPSRVSGRWKNYDVLDGPIGERIFAITNLSDRWRWSLDKPERIRLLQELVKKYPQSVFADHSHPLLGDYYSQLYRDKQDPAIAVLSFQPKRLPWTRTEVLRCRLVWLGEPAVGKTANVAEVTIR